VLRVEGLAPDYWMTAVLLVSSVMVPPHEHLSDDAETRTISALTYMVSLLRVVSGLRRNYSATVAWLSTCMVPPQEHLSDDAATRTIWAFTYMVTS
jgi:hypothetical protein